MTFPCLVLAYVRRARPSLVLGPVLNENDISIQTIRTTRANLIARKLGEVNCGAYASKDYLKNKGTPVTLSDLGVHYLVGDIQTREIRDKIENHFGPEIASQILHLRCDDHAIAWRMVVEGCGIGITHVSYGDSFAPVVCCWAPCCFYCG